jgi:hypothetical protein
MTDSSNWKEIASYSFLTVFANDDAISEGELHMLEKLALEDGKIDDHEKEMLRHIFDRANHEHMDEATIKEIADFRAEYQI